MPSTQTVFNALCIIWFASETWLGWRRRSGDRARTRDRGTLRLLLVTIYASLAVAAWLSLHGIGRFPEAARAPLFWLGAAMMAGGLAFRWWAIRVLARFFTVDVAIRDDHRLVREGPYRWLRHPSYTGSLLTFLGFGLALGSWAAFAVVAVPVTLAFLWRIRIEERALSEAFPAEYAEYARSTRRLVPFVW